MATAKASEIAAAHFSPTRLNVLFGSHRGSWHIHSEIAQHDGKKEAKENQYVWRPSMAESY